MIPLVPTRIPMLNTHAPKDDPSRDLVQRVWIQFFVALQAAGVAASISVGSVGLVDQVASVAAVALPTAPEFLPAGRYRVSTFVRVTTAASVSSSIQVIVGWVENGLTQAVAGTALTGNTTSTHESTSMLVVVDEGSQLAYATTYASVGTPMAYALDMVVEALP